MTGCVQTIAAVLRSSITGGAAVIFSLFLISSGPAESNGKARAMIIVNNTSSSSSSHDCRLGANCKYKIAGSTQRLPTAGSGTAWGLSHAGTGGDVGRRVDQAGWALAERDDGAVGER